MISFGFTGDSFVLRLTWSWLSENLDFFDVHAALICFRGKELVYLPILLSLVLLGGFS